MTNYQTMVTALREWTATHDNAVRAAVELLIEHGHWLRNDKFVELCVQNDYGTTWINWGTAELMVSQRDLIGSGSELSVLRFAVMIAHDQLGLSSLDRTNRELVVRALADALGGTW
jgi:hypothetical protein